MMENAAKSRITPGLGALIAVGMLFLPATGGGKADGLTGAAGWGWAA